jgi:hypothetical protein
MNERSFYIDQYTDEVMPCEPTLDGWAAWLAGGRDYLDDARDPDDDPAEGPPADGEGFTASAIRWLPDIVATFNGKDWALSAQPDVDDFIAARFYEGGGWSADDILSGDTVLEHIEEAYGQTFNRDDRLFFARGINENGWRITYHAGPPASCTAERVQ